MTFYRYATDLEVDVYHIIPCYLITQGRTHKSSDEHTFSFPCFANIRKGGASEKFHNGTTNCVGHVPSVNSEPTPSEIHISAFDQMAYDPIINISGEIVHVGCYFEGESRLFYYITKTLHQSGIVLGNHADPKQLCPRYRTD